MKKYFKTFIVILISLTFIGCEGNQKDARAIIGHSYQLYHNADDWETFYFSQTGTVQLTYCNQGEKGSYTHFTYIIQKNNVEIYMDKSDFWIDTSKGQLLGAFTYMPEDDCLYGTNGARYKRLN